MTQLDKNMQPKQFEAKIDQFWQDKNLFQAGKKDTKPFTIVIPPPNVTGSLHIGHALNNSLQDMIIRYHRLKGDDVLWLPGTDHAGIATQSVVERQLKEEYDAAPDGQKPPQRKEMGRSAFEQRVWQWKEQSGGTIIGQLKRLGASCDWSRERFTLDEGLSKAVLKIFVDLYNDGLIYRDKRLVNWDPKLQTAISDLEVKAITQQGHLWHIAYPIEHTDEQIIVATTRPETLLGDMAVAVHPDDERYKKLIGKYCELPLTKRKIPIIADHHANPEHGSGAVKITPAHDFNDFEVGKRHNLELLNIFDETAHLNENAPETYQGLERFEARKRILKDLEELGLLIKTETISHVVPYGDRGNVPIEPYLTWQWYVDAKVLAKPAIEAVRSGKIEIIPENWKKTYYHWMENIQPWCISRQLWWGHRVPAWFADDDTFFVAMSKEEAYQQAKAHFGHDDFSLTQDEDVLDTWFSSALWPFSTMGWPDETVDLKRHYPNDLLITGFDILFFWVARMVMMGMHFAGDIPFHQVYVHNLVLDPDGKKMSKSKGNVVNPLAIIDEYGADALRYTLISRTFAGRNIRISDDIIRGNRSFMTKIWNAARFCEMNGVKLPDNDGILNEPAPDSVADLASWLIYEVNDAREKFETAIEQRRFGESALVLYHFIWGGFCDWHLEFAKPIFNGDDEQAKAYMQRLTGWAFKQILILFHPLCPFITENLWQHLYDGGLERETDEFTAPALANTSWPIGQDKSNYVDKWRDINFIRQTITAIRGARAGLNVPASAKIQLICGGLESAKEALLKQHQTTLTRLARVDGYIFETPSPQAGTVLIDVDGAKMALPLNGLIDFNEERKRVEKSMTKLAKEIRQYDAKLGNPQFLENAPDDVVEDIKERQQHANTSLADLQSTLELLK